MCLERPSILGPENFGGPWQLHDRSCQESILHSKVTTEAIAGEGMIITAGGLDMHVTSLGKSRGCGDNTCQGNTKRKNVLGESSSIVPGISMA